MDCVESGDLVGVLGSCRVEYLVNGELLVNFHVTDAEFVITFVIQDGDVRGGGCRSQSKDATAFLQKTRSQ